MKTSITRREFNTLMGMAMTLPLAPPLTTAGESKPFRIRTITAGLALHGADVIGLAKAVGEAVTFDNPYLTGTRVISLAPSV